jgi:predicted exporter
MAVLMPGFRQLKQLTLVAMVGLQEGTVVALMLLPRLRLLRLLGCSPVLSQDCCQVLVGQLRLYELHVDVVVDDGSGRAEWMMRGLGERWREA